MEEARLSLNDRYRPLFLLQLVVSRWRIIVAFAVAGVMLALADATLTTRIYSASMVVGPVESLSGSGPTGLLGNLADLTGVSVDTPGSTDMAKYRLLMTGTLVGAEMDKRYHVLRELLPQIWNQQENRWKRPDEMPFSVRAWIKDMLGLNISSEPNAESLAELLQTDIEFSPIPKSPFMQVSYRSPDPAFAAQLLSELHQVTSQIYAQQMAAQIESQIDYVDNTLKTETRTNVRSAQIQLLEQYSNRLIMLRSGQQLLVQYIQPPVVSSKPAWPKAGLMLILGGVIGLVMGSAVSVVWPVDLQAWPHFLDWLRRRYRSTRPAHEAKS